MTTILPLRSASRRRPVPIGRKSTPRSRNWLFVSIVAAVILSVLIVAKRRSTVKLLASRSVDESTMSGSLTLQSPAFQHNQAIPSLYTRRDGENKSPPLVWSGVPDGTKSLALIVDDPDAPDPEAPKMTWVHWVVYNISPTTSSIEEGALPVGAAVGLNDFKALQYDGPSPPKGTHRYFFKIFALDSVLPDLGASGDKQALLKAMETHILEKTELIGTYHKK